MASLVGEMADEPLPGGLLAKNEEGLVKVVEVFRRRR